jgi:hypothetical protein
MPSRKKVILRTLDNTLHYGYLPLNAILSDPASPQPTVDLLDLSAHVLPIPLHVVRHIAYVRDFNLQDPENPENLLRRTFLTRPRTEGLWLRLTLTHSEPLEGLAPLDLSLADNLLEDRGLYLTPPDIRSNTQRLFLPRSAITSLQLLAVITTPSRSKPLPTPPALSDPELPFPA